MLNGLTQQLGPARLIQFDAQRTPKNPRFPTFWSSTPKSPFFEISPPPLRLLIRPTPTATMPIHIRLLRAALQAAKSWAKRAAKRARKQAGKKQAGKQTGKKQAAKQAAKHK